MTAKEKVEDTFGRIAGRTAVATGSVWAFSLAVISILIWAVLGPVFRFSEYWQLVINTSTTIVTFLMVFVIQHSQNKEMRAVQLKLNELIAAMEGSSNRLIDVEDLSDRELEWLYRRFRCLARDAQRLAPGEKTTIETETEERKDASAGHSRGTSRKGRRKRPA